MPQIEPPAHRKFQVMRAMWWIIKTLLLRSWLVVAGVAVGLLARIYLPTAEMQRSNGVVIPAAKQYYDQLLEQRQAAAVADVELLPETQLPIPMPWLPSPLRFEDAEPELAPQPLVDPAN